MLIKNDKEIITNLQEENERLKELCDKYEEEHSTKFNEWVFDKRENERLNDKIYGKNEYIKMLEKSRDDYKSRCEKAREMIRFIAYNSERPLTITELNKVYNILRGAKE